MGIVYDLIPRTAAKALEEFSEQFKSALVLATVEEWAVGLGASATSTAIQTTYPLSIYAAGYKEWKGEHKYRDLYMRSLRMKPRDWQDGVKQKARIVEAHDFMGWSAQPAAMAIEAKRLANKLVASVLEANPLLDIYRDDDTGTASAIALFASNHPYNVFDSSFGTFDNDITATAIDKAMMVAAKQHFRSLKAANGESMGLRMTHLLVPAAREEEAKDFLDNDLLVETILNGSTPVGGVTRQNRHKGTVTLVVSDELTDDDTVYALALDKPDLPPWIVQTSGAPEEIIHDRDSHMYKTSGEVAISYTLSANAAAAFPHPILKISGLS
jgi:phage major head subunit gpT-like protein